MALDKNKDGVINNGSELFGPDSGNGFAELAKYDSDNNGFIDQADRIYNSLRIWQRQEDGSQQLIALGEIIDTGVYLTENGKVGTIQQINLSA